MQCPICKVELKIADRQGIEVDYCPQCRGVWLDRGELDKIIERESAVSMQYGREPGNGGEYFQAEPYYEDYGHADYRYRKPNRGVYEQKRKRKSFLGEMFDFD